MRSSLRALEKDIVSACDPHKQAERRREHRVTSLVPCHIISSQLTFTLDLDLTPNILLQSTYSNRAQSTLQDVMPLNDGMGPR